MLSAGILSLATWLIEPLRVAVQPLVFLNTIIHELCHALAALATGGGVQDILIFPDASGVTHVLGGNTWIVGSAGYVGAAILGALFCLWASTPERSTKVLGVIALVIGFALVLFIRPYNNGTLGFGWAVALCALLGGAAKFAPASWKMPLAQFVGSQQILHAGYSLFTVASLSHYGVRTDAQILADQSPIPALVWSILWIGLSTVIGYVTLRKVWEPKA